MRSRQKRSKQKICAAIIAVAALVIVSVSIYLYQKNEPQTNLGVQSQTNTESSISTAEEITNTYTDENVENEVILYTSDELDLNLSSYYAAAAYTDGGVIYSKNSSERCYPASLTKLLTVSAAAKVVGKDYLFTVGDEIDLICKGSTIAYLKKGDVLDFVTLVDALLLPSGNDAAYVMAVGAGRAYSGNPNLSVNQALEVFISLMNKTAEELGCTDSHFVTPDGYHNENHYTTASDMLKIALHAANLDIVRNSVCQSKARHVFESGRDITWGNTNKLLSTKSDFYYSSAIGMKTGATDEAGKCLIAVAEKDGKEVIAVILNAASDEERYRDAIKVFRSSLG